MIFCEASRQGPAGASRGFQDPPLPPDFPELSAKAFRRFQRTPGASGVSPELQRPTRRPPEASMLLKGLKGPLAQDPPGTFTGLQAKPSRKFQVQVGAVPGASKHVQGSAEMPPRVWRPLDASEFRGPPELKPKP